MSYFNLHNRDPFGFFFDNSNSIYKEPVIKSEDDNLHVFFEVPGVIKEDTLVEYKDRQLSIKAYRASPDKRNWAWNYTLPDKYDGKKILARLENGVLELTIPQKTRGDPETTLIRIE